MRSQLSRLIHWVLSTGKPVFRTIKQATILFFLYGTLFVIGTVFFIIQFYTWVLPNWNFHRDFEQVLCTIVDARMVENRKDDSILFRPEIQISYTFREIQYKTWIRDEETLSTNQTLGNSYRAGQNAFCWVNVNEPTSAILYPPSQVWGWFFLLMMLLIASAGFAGLWLTFTQKRFSREHMVGKRLQGLAFLGASQKCKLFPTIPDPASINDSPGTHLAYRLPISQISVIRIIGLSLLSVFWNIIAWVVLFSVFLGNAEPPSSLVSRVFAVVFFLLGLGIIVWVINLAMTAFVVGATLLELSDHPIIPGRSYRLYLMQLGAFRIKDFTVTIICEEIARFRQGTDTITTHKEVFRKSLFHKTDFETQTDMPLVEETRFSLPYGAMHSFFTEHNEIRWKINIQADILHRPNLNRDCPIIVRPSQIVTSPYPGEYDDNDLSPR
jgi:hypothetical protein